jgi:RimJ/RimL family protein N-acetyltransferase
MQKVCDNEYGGEMKHKIEFIKITNDNLELACKVQNEIFPEEDARQNFVEQVNNDPYRKEMNYCIVYLDGTPIGVTGIYSYNEYPNDAWLGWFGILEKYRKSGYGGKVLDMTIKIAKEKGYENFRIYTDEYADDAHKLYESRGFIKEIYDREDDKDEYFIADIYIYSISLTNKKVELWNNKFLGLKEQGEKENLYKKD